jgi:hypothetical protein
MDSIIAFTDYDLNKDKNRHFWKGDSQHKRAISNKYCQILVQILSENENFLRLPAV